MQLYIQHFSSPVGILTLCADNQALRALYFGDIAPVSAFRMNTPLLVEAICQLDEYFQGRRQTFTLALAPKGTDFQRRVWDALCAVPYGQTRSYAQLAAAVGSAHAFRAVGQANHANPIPILIPCHRIVRTGGALGGYAGGLERKAFLLRLEREQAQRLEENAPGAASGLSAVISE